VGGLIGDAADAAAPAATLQLGWKTTNATRIGGSRWRWDARRHFPPMVIAARPVALGERWLADDL